MIDRNYTTSIRNGSDATGAHANDEARPAAETATRGETRGEAGIRASQPPAPFQWQADGEG